MSSHKNAGRAPSKASLTRATALIMASLLSAASASSDLPDLRPDLQQDLSLQASRTPPSDQTSASPTEPAQADLAQTRTNDTAPQAAQADLAQTRTSDTTPQAALPIPSRESLLQVPFGLPAGAVNVLIAVNTPGGSTYLPGSARLNGQPLSDPLVSASGTLYWHVEGAKNGELTFRVQHQGALAPLGVPGLLARFPRERQELLQGTVDLKEYASATPAFSAGKAENSGLLKLPIDGSAIRNRDRISVVIEGPLGQTTGATINGELLPDSAIGQREVNEDAGTERITYFGIRLRSGVNTLVLGGERVTVTAAGALDHVEVTPVQDLADGSTPVRFRLRALDQSGNAASVEMLTLRSSIEPAMVDADPNEGGFQIRLVNGEAELILPPQNAPLSVRLEFLIGEKVRSQSVNVRASLGTVGIGAASATVGLSGGQLDFRYDAKGYFEGTLGSGKLYATANTSGLPAQANPNARFPLYGDASSESVPLQGQDPVAFRYEHPDFSAQYRLSNTPIDVLPFGETVTALSVTTKGPVKLAAFAALIDGDKIKDENVPLSGTRLLHLARTEVAPDSETLTLVTRDRVSGQELKRKTLVRGSEYVLDFNSGVISLASALPLTDDDLNPLSLLASYRVLNGGTNRTLAYGAQARYSTKLGAGTDTFNAGIGAVSASGVLTAGFRAGVSTGTVQAEVLGMTSGGGVQLSGTVSGQLAGADFSARGAYQDQAYTGLAPIPVGFSANATLSKAITRDFSASLGADYTGNDKTSQGNVSARADYRLNALSFGAGVRYSFGAQQGLSGLAGIGYHEGKLDVDLTHSQPISGTVDPETTLVASYTVTPGVKLKFTDTLNWKSGQTASFGVTSTLGGTNLSASYDLPNASGNGNRARFGADTVLPLSGALSAALRGAYTRDLNTGQGTFSVGSDLRYTSPSLSAVLGGDLAYSAGAWRPVLKGGLTGTLSDGFSVTADGTADLSSAPGLKLAVGYAYRGGAWNSIGNVRYQDGSLAGSTKAVSAEISGEYHESDFAFRGGLNARMLLEDPLSLTYQPSVSGTYHLTPTFGLGASFQALLQPGTGTSTYGLGVEATLRALPGTWITVGYNALGFDGISPRFTKPGVYLRLDLLLDETTGESK